MMSILQRELFQENNYNKSTCKFYPLLLLTLLAPHTVPHILLDSIEQLFFLIFKYHVIQIFTVQNLIKSRGLTCV